MQLPPYLTPEELLQYAQDEIDRKARQERAERRAILDQKLEEIEVLRAATVKADREREAAECFGARTAEFLSAQLGDGWVDFVALLRQANVAKFVVAVNRIENERLNLLRRQNVDGVAEARVDATAHAAAVRKARIESELAAAGVAVNTIPGGVAA